ncbi:PREDICTED: uncharacterized protein LOC107188062 [Dufourea novaeangliae]|uniref:uncharacterized protein LOC107188062 n=1 Tax=Dufourea novaeangliae TaxID=178035 RepID=UPI000767A7FC|nr:PREDICTED: uncharacterized protein LOC107188062 [Dufourea novaeangliae]
MSVSSKSLNDKILNLRPELSNGISPEIFERICEQPLAQPFLKWFNENVNYINVLSNEELQIKNRLQNNNEWLEGPELDCALEEATKKCPDLLKIVSFDDTNITDLFVEYETVKDAYKEDENFILVIQNGISNLKEVETQLDENIEKESEYLHRECITADKTYEDCLAILNDFDANNREFYREVECLLNMYADAAENKGVPLVWTQMPLELFSKNLELYNHYLGVHIKNQFGDIFKEGDKKDSNYVSLINDCPEIHIDNEKLQELTLCKANLTNIKVEEILAKIRAVSYIAMLEHVKDIYNAGNLKVPKVSELRTEISKLTSKRDFLEESVSLQERQLTDITQQFAELEMKKVLKQDACSKLKQRKVRLEELKNLLFLAREHGHVHADLLCILMQIQFSRLRDISEFVADSHHYLTSEYSLSSARCESMQQQQQEYFTLMSSSPNTHNSFNKILVSMLYNDDNAHQFDSALDRYNELIDENRVKKQFIIETHPNSRIDKLKMLGNEISEKLASESQKGPTYTFKSGSYEIETSYKEMSEQLQNIHTDLTKMRNQMKKQMKTRIGFELERNVLWQRFLVDPDTLIRKYKEAKLMSNKSSFENVFETE